MKRIKVLMIVTIIMAIIIIGNLSNSKKDILNEGERINQISENLEEENKIDELNDEIIGTLEIKKIQLVGKIKEGSTKDILKDYIGHIEETPIYDGNVCLAAHNRGNKYSYFAKINQLQNGDNIVYKTDFFEKHYIVDNIKVIDETDWTLLEDTGEEKITLITCIKNQKSKRLCVQAIKVD
ncbi:MAG: class D sortase [Clostridia bacterium]|nr:class D sortase [Clostridia bacterium]